MDECKILRREESFIRPFYIFYLSVCYLFTIRYLSVCYPILYLSFMPILNILSFLFCKKKKNCYPKVVEVLNALEDINRLPLADGEVFFLGQGVPKSFMKLKSLSRKILGMAFLSIYFTLQSLTKINERFLTPSFSLSCSGIFISS